MVPFKSNNDKYNVVFLSCEVLYFDNFVALVAEQMRM